jgi:hypothetical protein
VTGMFVLDPEELVLEAIEEYRKNPDVIINILKRKLIKLIFFF